MSGEGARLLRWQVATIGLLFAVYCGYYLCRSNLSVATPRIVAELADAGIPADVARERIGWIVSLGTVGYALGKFLAGGLADTLGGRRIVLAGMVGSIACTVLFATGDSLPVHAVAWMGNRLLQSLGWVGIVAITARWVSYVNYGRVMALLSLSFLIGDAAARRFMGALLEAGLDWRTVFLVAASVLGGLLVASLFLLRESPRALGLPEPPANPANVYGADDPPADARALLRPLLTNAGFWMVCLLSCGLTLLRETFNQWTPTYFVEGLGLGVGEAASWSGVFPLFGAASVVLMGFLSDRIGSAGRAGLIALGTGLAGLALLALGVANLGPSRTLPVALVGLVGFLLVGPYSFLAGAIALDLGGKRGSATASGLIDGVGYVGGVLAGLGTARVANRFGWQGAFLALAAVAWATAVVASAFLAHQVHASRRRIEIH